MKKELILVSLLFCTNLFALECDVSSFNKGNKEMKQIYSLYNMTTGTPEEQKEMNKSVISRKDYKKQMSALKNKLVSLNEKKSYLSKAKIINNKNINTWKSLTKSCKDGYLLAVQGAFKDAKKMQKIIQQREATIQSFINRTEIVIDVGIKKYNPENIKNTKESL